MKPIPALIVCLCLYAFFDLAVYSWHKMQPYDVDGLNALSAKVTAKPRTQAEALHEIWNLSEDDVKEPIKLW